MSFAIFSSETGFVYDGTEFFLLIKSPVRVPAVIWVKQGVST